MDCIPWPTSNGDGYARIFVSGQRWLAHRWVWTRAYGPIPDGLTVDHVCKVRHCVNLSHLRLLTREDNANDCGARRTALPTGEFHSCGDPLVRVGSGRRFCRSCKNARERAG